MDESTHKILKHCSCGERKEEEDHKRKGYFRYESITKSVSFYDRWLELVVEWIRHKIDNLKS